MMPTCAYSTYRLAQLVIDQAETLAPSSPPSLPFIALPVGKLFLFVVRFLGSSSVALFWFASACCAPRHVFVACLLACLPCGSRVDLLFPLATTNIAHAPGSSSVHRATSIATFCLCSGCHAQYSPRQLTKVVQKKQKGRVRTRRRRRRSTRTTHTHFITSISMGPTYLLLSLLMFLWCRGRGRGRRLKLCQFASKSFPSL